MRMTFEILPLKDHRVGSWNWSCILSRFAGVNTFTVTVVVLFEISNRPTEQLDYGEISTRRTEQLNNGDISTRRTEQLD